MRGLLVVVVVMLFIFTILGTRAETTRKNPPQLTRLELKPTDRILVIAPHPDDETLSSGGLIRHAVTKGIPVKVTLMTCGDSYRGAVEVYLDVKNPVAKDYQRLGVVRYHETLRAMAKLGLSKDDVIVLAYADGSINSLYRRKWDSDQLHLGRNGEMYAPYSFAYEKKAPYCGENVVKNLAKIVKDFCPSIIIYPDYEDFHHDHWATAAFVEYTTTKIGYQGERYTYLVHRGPSWPVRGRYASHLSINPPAALGRLDVNWRKFSLTSAEKKLKRQAVFSYKSQELLAEPFFEAFVRNNELFAQYSDIKVAPVETKPDFFAPGDLPEKIVFDPIRDARVKRFGGRGDLAGVSFAYDNQNTWLAIAAWDDIAPNVVYSLHLHIFEENRVKRLDVDVLNGKSFIRSRARNSIGSGMSLPVEFKGNRLVIQLPSSLFLDAHIVLVNVDTCRKKSDERYRIDHTGWRRLLLK